MQAVVDHVTGMVYWVPAAAAAADQSTTVPPLPTVPVVMQPAYRYHHHIYEWSLKPLFSHCAELNG